MDLEGSSRIRHNRIRVEIRSESDRPNYETQRYVICESLVQHKFYVLRPELGHVLGMVIDLLWADQMLLRNWVVTKVGFRLVQTHAVKTWSRKMGFAPPIRRDILWAPRVIRPG